MRCSIYTNRKAACRARGANECKCLRFRWDKGGEEAKLGGFRNYATNCNLWMEKFRTNFLACKLMEYAVYVGHRV